MKAERFANFILGGGAILSTLLLGYVIFAYDLIRLREFTSPVGRLLYHGLPAVAAVLLFASLRLSSSHKVNFSLILLSTGVSIYAAELLLPAPIPAVDAARRAAARRAGITFDTRSKLEVITDLRGRGIDAYPSIPGLSVLPRRGQTSLKSELSIDGTEVLPLGGIANKMTVLCNEGGEWVIYESDEHGFHNPKGIWARNRIDIAAVGDSFVEGYCVPSDKNFVALIRRRYPATLSLGLGGYGPLTELAAIREYLQPLRSQVVLWFFFEGNDLCELRAERTSPLLMSYLGRGFSQGLADKQATIDRALIAYTNKRKPIRGLEELLTLRHIRERLGVAYGAVSLRSYGCVYVEATEDYYVDEFREEDVGLFRQVLVQAKESISTWGGRLYFVYLPDWLRYSKPTMANRDRERVLTLVRTVGIPIIDLHQFFQAQSDPLALFPLRLTGHYSVEGHQVVAEAVLQSISLDKR